MPITSVGARDRGAMSTRYASVTPEQLAQIQRELEDGIFTNWADLCDRMLQRDADILATYESRLSVISGADIVVEPGELTGDPARDAYAEQAARWVRSWLMRMPYGQYTHESLDGIGRGLSVHEIEWTETENGLVPERLEWLHPRRFRYGRDWAPRICDLGPGQPYSTDGYELEPDRFIVHQPRVIPGYPVGGALRPVMWLFLIKSWALQFWTAGSERYAYPLAVATVERGVSDEVRAKLEDMLERLSVDHAGIIDSGTTLQLLETTVKDGGVWKDLIAELNKGVEKALVGMTDLSNPSQVGAYRAVETRKGATVDARILKDERALAYTWQRDLIEPAIRLNLGLFGGVMPPIPQLSWSIAASRRTLDAIGVLAMEVDEVRAAQGLAPKGGAVGRMLWRDFIANAAAPTGSQVGGQVLS